MSTKVTCSADALISRADAAFSSARAQAGGHDLDLTIGGRRVRISFAGTGLESVFRRALAAPSAEQTSTPTLTLKAWDGSSTGTPLDLPAPLAGMEGRLGLLESLCDERYRVQVGAAFMIIDRQRREAFLYVPDPRRLPYWEIAHPARLVFAAWAPTAGLRMCHAAAVGDAESGLLFAGAGGSGKSTVALACLAAGMRCAGDDYVLIETGSAPVVHSLYGSTLLRPDHQRRWPMLMPRVDNADGVEDGDKALMFAEHGALSGGFELRAVVVPRVDGTAPPSLRSVGPARALRALAPSSILQLGAFDPEALEHLGELCRSLPCLELALGSDVRGIPATVTEALRLTRAQSASAA